MTLAEICWQNANVIQCRRCPVQNYDLCPNDKERGKMVKNKMAEVAKLLGQKINKRFTVEYFNTKFDCMFFINVGRKYDFIVLNKPEFSFFFNEQILYALITGEAVINDE